ncbi:DUF4829 domain-containing protein [Clostridium sp. YIM B02505]|uniref:DUF4829 domain-containing protein n=1 Tax=Clostridium yunnanense TaxID=2800325 RepID=A0ABS1ESG1_9CLOT|nr:DUF4829 domain-containing protein [Clostridium yunnanense]MBK1812318.1 DUF4829 domain-containing protein [Clostridium yunnanense]
MRKVIMSLCTILLLLSLVACKSNNASSNLTVDNGQSTKFTKEEVNKAIDCVKNNFAFKGCTLTKVWYDEEKSDSIAKSYMSNGRGAVNGVKSENVIVLLSNFDVDGSGENPVLNPNSTYSDYQWILIRDKKNSKWTIDDKGY